jgi:hypothetical protein
MYIKKTVFQFDIDIPQVGYLTIDIEHGKGWWALETADLRTPEGESVFIGELQIDNNGDYTFNNCWNSSEFKEEQIQVFLDYFKENPPPNGIDSDSI